MAELMEKITASAAVELIAAMMYQVLVTNSESQKGENVFAPLQWDKGKKDVMNVDVKSMRAQQPCHFEVFL